MAAGDFFVSEANRQAHAMVLASDWPLGKLALIGPQGSGKSHLARIWAETLAGAQDGASGGIVTPARALPALPRPPDGARIVVEDMEELPRHAEENLFHLHNRLAATGGRLLMTARCAPSQWAIALPDLASRMQGTSVVRIEDPDDALLFAVLAKLFADRQLAPEPGLVPWLAARIERSFAAAHAVVARLDSAGLAERREITRVLARHVLDKADPADS